MSEPKYALTGVGNAIVDLLSKVDDQFISDNDMTKGIMQLIDEPRALALTKMLNNPTISSGGSAANTLAGFASFGGNCAFIGKVSDDVLGREFRDDMAALGVKFDTQPLMMGPASARCLIMVTPDAERTMNTFLGASTELHGDDIDADLIASSFITYLEGYLFDKPQAKHAFIKAAEIAHEAGHRIALTLSDPFCVERHREDFQSLVENHIDILFANEDEIKSLYQQETFEDAAQIIAGKCEVAVLTRSEKGAVIVTRDEQIIVEAVTTPVVDTTGAGDQFAAGFLYGYTQGMPLTKCGELGAMAAAEVISHMGPRPEASYRDFLKKAA
ncbi:MAG: adenosine kinase [Rhodospirillales bacterium]|nr:adenosine kinase [Rhodospirillales bacterium]MCB9973000.1 adenosine kinase [Rhodospirillales bacterium]